MSEDPLDHGRLFDERDQAQTAAAPGTRQHVKPERARCRYNVRRATARRAHERKGRSPANGRFGSADVQTLDPEASSVHVEEAPIAAVRRQGGLRCDAPGDPGIRGSSHSGRVRTQVRRSHSRRTERGPSHGREVGPPPENPARGVDMPTLRCVRPKWALTTGQAASLLTALPPLARTMVGLAILSVVRDCSQT